MSRGGLVVSSSFPAARFPAVSLREEVGIAGPPEKTLSAQGAEPTDEALIARISAKDSDALGLLFRRYSRLVWTIANRIVRNNEESDDVLQDVFLLVRDRASVFDPARGSVRSLLVQISYQRAFSRRRYLECRNFYSVSEVTENPVGSFSVPRYDECLEAQFGRGTVKRAFDNLSAEQRETLRLCFGEGFTIEEIAVRMGDSPGNTRHHYYRGLAKLRKYLLKR